MSIDDEIRDRLDRLTFNRNGFGQDDGVPEALDRLDRMARFSRELAGFCEQRAASLRTAVVPHS